MDKVLVTDGQQRNTLAITRSLGRKNIKVFVGEDTRFATSFYSKYCEDFFVYPNPEKNSDEFVKFLLEYLSENKFDVFFPVTNATVIPVVHNLDKFRKIVKVPLADKKIMMSAMDKGETIDFAKKCGVPVPRTVSPLNIDELNDENLDYPVIVKPRVGYGARGVSLCQNKGEMLSAYKQNLSEYGPSLIQEYIPPGGDEVGVYTLFNNDSEPRAVTVHKRIRSYPHTGGPSTLRETIKNPALIEHAFTLLKEMKWFGVAMVEFRVDPRDNVPKLMEINPRWWGSLPLSIFSGVDFPYLLYKLSIQGDINKNLEYKVGVKCRWMLPGDILHLVTAPDKLKNLKEFIRFKQKDTGYDILSSDDPGALVGFLLAVMRFGLDKNMWQFIIRKPVKGIS